MDAQITQVPDDARVYEAVDTLKLLADPTRLRILWALLHGEHSVNLLAEHVGSQPAAVSQHLAKLRLARLVRSRRQGTHVFYLRRTTTFGASSRRRFPRPTTSSRDSLTTTRRHRAITTLGRASRQ